MKTHNLPDPILIENKSALDRMLDDLSQEAALGVDTEANSLHAYQEQVCLIQISTLERDYLVDPLAIEDLSSLRDIFSDPKIEKIFHASEYDVIMLAKDLGFEMANIFDTMLAARILGRKKMGLDSLLEELLGVKVNKRYQKADWGKRPLPAGMLRYAQIDTHYLIDIRNILATQLRQAKRWELAQEDFTRACNAHERPSRQKLPPCWRGNGPQDLSPQKAAVYKKLCDYRDGIAQKKDKPLFKVFSRRFLVTLAEECPRNQHELRTIKGVPHWMKKRYGAGLLKSIQEGLEAEPFAISYPQRPDRDYLDRVQELKAWRKKTAKKMGVNSAVILPRVILNAIAENNPHTREELESVMEEVPWRMEHFGKEILRTIT
ncbi:MAG: Ribonuclease D [Chloroflexi bacterium]|nr:Ribonuclease D [Chloroflexota bacterium]